MIRIFIIITLVIFVGILASPFIVFFGNNLMVVTSDSMYPALKVNDLIIVKPLPIDEINQGDIIAFDSHIHNIGTIIHRAIKIFDDHGQLAINTKGDNSGAIDPWIVHDEDLIGKVIQNIPAFGLVLENTVRLPIVIVIMAIVIFLLKDTLRISNIKSKSN
ncbi:MAG: signal peptidase I [Thaumarchaeota archaeon]|nr:signal peptidase I [Nitrososphaerota archaeon]